MNHQSTRLEAAQFAPARLTGSGGLDFLAGRCFLGIGNV